jgi:hypothetical protein
MALRDEKNDLPLPGDEEKKKGEVSMTRLAIWLIVGGIGAYFLLTGLTGIFAAG